MAKIFRSDMLKEMDIKETPDGQSVFFAAKFVTKNGKLIFLPRARKCGLRQNVKESRTIGLQPFDVQGNAIGHVYPVSLDGFIEFNNQIVVL